jgi:hypothetical protein
MLDTSTRRKYLDGMEFSDTMRDMINKGLEASRDIVSKAAAQAQTWGEMGVLKVEVVQLRAQAEKLTARLGAETYAAFAERKESSLAADSPSVVELLGRISDIGRMVQDKETAFRRLGGKESDLDNGSSAG